MSKFLILVGALLIFLNIKSLKKGNKTKDEKCFNEILKNESENMSELKMEVINMRKDFAETVLELQLDIKELKEENMALHSELLKIKFDNKKEEKALEYETNKVETIKKEKLYDEKDEKIEKIRELINKGINEDEICEKLSIGKGELLLIKDLYV